jgi:hypothetical protein
VKVHAFLTSALDGDECQFYAPSTLPPGKEPLVSLDRRLSGPQSQPGRGDEEKNSQLLLGFEPPIIQPVAQRYATELSQLLPIFLILVICSTGIGQSREVCMKLYTATERKQAYKRTIGH